MSFTNSISSCIQLVYCLTKGRVLEMTQAVEKSTSVERNNKRWPKVRLANVQFHLIRLQILSYVRERAKQSRMNSLPLLLRKFPFQDLFLCDDFSQFKKLLFAMLEEHSIRRTEVVVIQAQ